MGLSGHQPQIFSLHARVE